MICQVIETVSGKEQGMKYGDIPVSQGGIARQVIQMYLLWGVVNSLYVQLLLCNHSLLSQKHILSLYISSFYVYDYMYIFKVCLFEVTLGWAAQSIILRH